jgi:hypothetical protein
MSSKFWRNDLKRLPGRGGEVPPGLGQKAGGVRDASKTPGRLSPRPGGRREAAAKDAAGHDCLTATPPDNSIDSRSRRWHISCQRGGRGHRAPAHRPGSPAGLGEPWPSPRAVLAGRGKEPETPPAGCRRAKCCRSAPQVKMSYSRLTAPVAQGTEQRTSNPSVGGSNPPRRANDIKQLVAHNHPFIFLLCTSCA